jgi:hypothetical protein
VKKRISLVGGLLIAAAICIAWGARTHLRPAPAVEGFAGQVTILPNASRKEVTVVLTKDTAQTGKQNQMVFHVQGFTDRVPLPWSGAARVLAGDDVLAVLPSDTSQGVIFSFPGISIPSNLKSKSLSHYPVYGIGLFGKNEALSDVQIQQLVSSGRVETSMGKIKFDEIHFFPNAMYRPVQTCQSGGRGASACMGDGCSVTCQSGFYACCYEGSCTCFQE